ncbi:MAG: hypothetical protein RQ758_08220 [Methanomicrobiaceae archaeon]|nr:hypothetical protein [Methanomicrobiaceae archaeon]
MGNKRRRLCRYCGFPTEREYSDEEWASQGQACEECYLFEHDGVFEE